MSQLNKKSPGFKTCGHNCHVFDTRTRLAKEMRHLHIVNTAASGVAIHDKKHNCTPASHCPDPTQNQPSNWPTTNLEYVKFASRLMARRKGLVYDLTLEQYKASWRALYPDKPVPLTSEGEPVDHALDPNHPCPDVPWLQEFLIYHQPSESSSEDATNPNPKSSQPAPSSSQPIASSSDITLEDFASMSVHDIPMASPISESEPSPTQHKINYLLTHSFPVNLSYPHPHLEHIFPQFRDHLQAPLKCLMAFFILCPQYQITDDHMMSSYFCREEISETDMSRIQRASKNHIEQIKDAVVPKGRVQCSYHSWINLPLEMASDEDRWKVSYLRWKVFQKAVLSGKGITWDSMMNVDLVIGGMDFSIDFLSPLAQYDTSPSNCVCFFANMQTLAKNTTVWPHPEELFLSGSKVQGCETIRVASLSMDLSVPMYTVADDLIDNPEFQETLKNGSFHGVLKRDYSMRSEHVIVPQTPNPVDILKKATLNQRKTWAKVRDFFSEPKWFVQPFVAHLVYIGEVRVVIVGGRIVYKITTIPARGEQGGWEVTDNQVIRPIHMHKYTPDAPEDKRYTFLPGHGVPLRAFDDPKNLLEHYALTILGKIILLEERQTARMSGLRLFCQLDVSVFRAQNTGTHSFFVNEITRSHGSALFQEWIEPDMVDPIFEHLMELLHLVASKKLYLSPPILP